MSKLNHHRTWDTFLFLISETDNERKYLERIMHKQMKKIENYNKKIISSITEEKKVEVVLQEDNLNSEDEDDDDDDDEKKKKIKKGIQESVFMSTLKSMFTNKKKEEILKPIRTGLQLELEKHRKLEKKKNDIKKKKFKFATFLDENGNFFKNKMKLKKGFYDDLNYGDMTMVFNNDDTGINSKLKFQYRSIQNFFNIFKDKINLVTTLKEFHNDYLKDEAIAFYNALWFFSSDFYCKITPRDNVFIEEEKGSYGKKKKKKKKSKFGTKMINNKIITGIEEYILEDEKDFDEENYPEFRDIIQSWRFENDQEYKKVIKMKLIYKEKIFIKFLRVTLQQKRQIKDPSLISKFKKEIDKEFKKLEIKNGIYVDKKKIKKSKGINHIDNKKYEIIKSLIHLHLFPVKVKDKPSCKILIPHFKSLIKKIIIKKLNHMKIATRSFNSSDFKKIFLILKIQKTNLSQRAEIEKFPKEFELGLIDLVSFDPIDTFNRPYRMKKINFSEYESRKEKEEAETFDMYQSTAKTDFSLLKLNGGNTKSLTKIITNLEEYTIYDIHNLLNLKLIEFRGLIDKFLKKTQNNIIITRIIQDNLEGRDKWHAFVLYMLLFKYYTKGLKKFSKFDSFYKYEGLIYRLIATKALKDTNHAFKMKNLGKIQGKGVKSVWDELKLKSFYAPFSKYVSSKKINKYWRKFEINELGDRETFIQKERIQVLMGFMTKAFKLDELVQNNLVLDYFCLDDQFIKFGNPKLPLFVHLLDIQKILKNRDSYQNKSIREFLELFEETAEESDFLEQSLKRDLKFKFFFPWYLSIDPIRDYYGEKIAIYFSYLTFYSKAKCLMAFLGLIIYILQKYFLDNTNIEAYKITSVVFAAIILLWTIGFSEYWKRRQALFAMRYGQTELDLDNKSNVRPGFEGIYIRNIDNNDMNVLYYSSKKRFVKYLASYSISFLIVILSVGCSLAILMWKNSVDPTDLTLFYLITIINAIQIIVFEIVYKFVAVRLNDYENHATSQAYRDSLIMKLFVFQFCNNFNSFFLIAFVKANTDIFGKCQQSSSTPLTGVDCFNELTIQVEILFIVQFFVAFLKILIPIVLLIKRKVLKLIESKWKIKNYPWKNIDRLIEQECDRDKYITTLQIDGTLLDILKLMIQLAFLSLFSISFPLAFSIAAVGGLIDIRMEVFRFLETLRRPIPLFSKDIGLWQTILEFIILFTIFVNSAIISFTLKGMGVDPETTEQQIKTFIIIVIIFMILRYSITLMVDVLPENMEILKKRHNRIRSAFQNLEFSNFSTNLRSGVYFNIPNNLKEEFMDIS